MQAGAPLSLMLPLVAPSAASKICHPERTAESKDLIFYTRYASLLKTSNRGIPQTNRGKSYRAGCPRSRF